MKQSRWVSFFEVAMSTAIGFALSFSVGPLYFAFLGVEYSNRENLVVVLGFTLLSLARGYFVRRFFNNGMHNVAVSLSAQIKRKFA